MKKIIWFIIIIILFLLILSIFTYPVNKNAKIIVTDENNEEICYVINGHYSNKENIEKIKNKHIDFIITIEDKSFYKHSGFNLYRIFKAFFNNIFKNSSFGASTITQQYIKNTYLKNEKSIGRKIKEIFLAIKAETYMTKDEILEEYLSSIYFGNNVYGLTNASIYYFNKTPKMLSDIEIISLIALWNSPSLYSVDLSKWTEKKNMLVDYLLKNNKINFSESLSLKSDIPLNINKEFINSNRHFFIDQVLKEYKDYNISSKLFEDVIINTNYTKDLEDIKIKCNSNYSAIITNKLGYIVGIIGDKYYDESGYNIAINGKRDIGSTIKPLLYYEAIKCKLDESIFDSSPYKFLYNNEYINITNSSGIYYGPINMKYALAVSDNIYAMKMHLALGTNTLALHMKKYGIKASALPSLALGSISLSLKEINDIYTQFFTDGKYLETKFITNIYYKKRIYQKTINEKRLNDKEICLKIKELLRAPFDSSISHSTLSALNSQLNVVAYGKTGTTDYDSYLIGFTDNYLVSAWSGYKDGKLLDDSLSKHAPKALFVEIMKKKSWESHD